MVGKDAKAIRRGYFIVLEGIDRSGKSSQVKNVTQFLERNGWKVQTMHFPDRRTKVGAVIDDYLKGAKIISPECLHLLFSANRWEKQSAIESILKSGCSIVCDRYAYSGIAYSVGVHNLEFDWCFNSDKGLIKPDIVYQLDADPVECSQRSLYGEEQYERIHLQQRVAEAFKMFHHYDNWILVKSASPDVGSTTEQVIDAVTEKIYNHLKEFLVCKDSASGINRIE